MKGYKEFKAVILKAKKGDIVPEYHEIVYIGDGKNCEVEFHTCRTDIIQAIAKATTLDELQEDEEMIIVIKKFNPEEDEDHDQGSSIDTGD